MQKRKYYPLTLEEWKANVTSLKPAELKILYYLRTLNPFGDSWIDLTVTDLAEELNLDKSTVSRALRRLASQKVVDLEIQTARIRLLSRAQVLPTDNSLPTDNFGDRHATSAIATQQKLSVGNSPVSKPAQGKGSRKAKSTNNRSNLLNNKTIGTGTEADSLRSINSEAISTEISTEAETPQSKATPLFQLITDSGLQINKTIEQAIAELQNSENAASAARSVENALSALTEQRKRGAVRNPGGFFVAALRRGFTPNEAKKQAKARTKPPDLLHLEMQIGAYLGGGHRNWALNKLQSEWEEYPNLIKQLVETRPHWGFKVSAKGVIDDRSEPLA